MSRSDQAQRVLKALAGPDCFGRSALAAGMVSLIGKRGGVSLVVGQVPLGVMDALVHSGHVCRETQGEVLVYRLASSTPRLAPAQAPKEALPVPSGGKLKRVKTGQDSPLVWLARRKDKNGEPLIPPTALAAGERLQQDFLQAGLSPKMSSDWSGLPASTGGRNAAALLESERQVAARQRFRRALEACGSEFSGVLLDLCCFLKPLDQVEQERGWPARSGKVVLAMALAALMRHYGLGESAKGRASKQVIHAWRSPESA